MERVSEPACRNRAVSKLKVGHMYQHNLGRHHADRGVLTEKLEHLDLNPMYVLSTKLRRNNTLSLHGKANQTVGHLLTKAAMPNYVKIRTPDILSMNFST